MIPRISATLGLAAMVTACDPVQERPGPPGGVAYVAPPAEARRTLTPSPEVHRWLAASDSVRAQLSQLRGTLATGELLLLCSDGLSGELSDEQIQQLCAEAETLDELVEQLIGLANQLGGKDNISCVVLGLNTPESPVIAARPRNFLSRWLSSRKP